MEPINENEDTTPITVHTQEAKRRKRRALKILLYFIAGIIALGIFSVWLLHKDNIEALRFGQSFLLSVKLRSLEIKNSDGNIILYGDLGRDLLATPYDHCWDMTFEFYEDSCLHWQDTARLKVSKDENSTSSCYTFHWEGLVPEFAIEDCFYLQSHSWYGYITNTTNPWPISGLRMDDSDYSKEYPLEQTNHLVPIWFGSQGVVIFVDSGYPFGVSWNITDRRQFCITSHPQQQVYFKPLNFLHYTVCQGHSLKDVYNISRRHRLHKEPSAISGQSGQQQQQQQQQQILPHPVYVAGTRDHLLGLLGLIRSNVTRCSLIELFDEWEEVYGNLSLDANISETIHEMLLEAATHECYLTLPISPFFSYKSQHYKNGVSNHYFVRDKQNLATRMITWRGHEGAVLDISNPKARDWFISRIQGLVDQLNVKALKLLNVNLPPDTSFFDYNVSQLDYPKLFYRVMSTLNVSVTMELTIGFITSPVYIPIHMNFFNNAGQSCLNTSIPYALVMSMSGYPLLEATSNELVDNSTSEEMIQTWLNVAIFFPQLKIPSTVLLSGNKTQELLQEALDFRSDELLPYMSQVWHEEPQLPIIRPVWWVAPDDRKSRAVNDQFLVGDNLLVAPVLCEYTQKRAVYLPEGTWRGYDMKLLKGPRTITIDVTNSSVAIYFWREGRAVYD